MYLVKISALSDNNLQIIALTLALNFLKRTNLFQAGLAAALEAVPLSRVLLPNLLQLGSRVGRRQVAQSDLLASADRANGHQILDA
jgi:hypothetical protein